MYQSHVIPQLRLPAEGALRRRFAMSGQAVLEGIGELLKGRDGRKVKRGKDGLGYNFSKGPSDFPVNCGTRRTPGRAPVTPQ